MVFLICVHEGVGLWAEKGTLLTIILGAFLVYDLRHIVHAMPPEKVIECL